MTHNDGLAHGLEILSNDKNLLMISSGLMRCRAVGCLAPDGKAEPDLLGSVHRIPWNVNGGIR